MDLDLRRRFFAEDLQVVCNLKSQELVDAFAAVPRERFLPPGPWTLLGDGTDGFMMGGPPRTRTTPDADPARVYHNVAIAIDPERQLFNGQPGTLAMWIDALALPPGGRVLHIGCGLGYYTAVMAQTVGSTGRVLAFEVDAALADASRRNLASMSWVEVRAGDAAGTIDDSFDAVFVNAGVTHPLDSWLDVLAPGGRVILPLTGAMPAMGPHIGKGVTWLLTRLDDASLSVRPVGVVAVYSALGVRDEELNVRVGKALMGGPMQWMSVKRLRRDAHDESASCWLHSASCCWSTA